MKSAGLGSKVLDKVLGRTDFATPATMYAALYTTAPTLHGGGVEVPLVNGYARVSVPNSVAMWPASIDAGKSNASAIVFPSPTGPWGTIVAFGLHEAATGDVLYLWGILDTPALVGSGSVVRFEAGELAFEEA